MESHAATRFSLCPIFLIFYSHRHASAHQAFHARVLALITVAQRGEHSPVGHQSVLWSAEHGAHVCRMIDGRVEVGVIADRSGEVHGGVRLIHEGAEKKTSQSSFMMMDSKTLAKIPS